VVQPVTPAAPTARPPVTPAAAAAPTLPASAPVQPGQTWVLTGTPQGAPALSRTITLSRQAPVWDEGWEFSAPAGQFTYDPQDQSLIVLDNSQEEGPFAVCMALLSGGSASGILLMAPNVEAFEAVFEETVSAFPGAESMADFIAAARARGYATCTVVRR
jgi:hypothetical protein